MSYDLHKVSVRNALKPRAAPYSAAPIGDGEYVQFRKLANGTGTWIAYKRCDDGKQLRRSLGQVTAAFGYAEAAEAARKWFKETVRGVSQDVPTVSHICREYVEELTADKRPKAAYDARVRFERADITYLLGDRRLALGKVNTKHFRAWRDDVAGTVSAQDRSWATLKAALNAAVRNKRVSPGCCAGMERIAEARR